MTRKYEEPGMEVIWLEKADVVTVSGDPDEGPMDPADPAGLDL